MGKRLIRTSSKSALKEKKFTLETSKFAFGGILMKKIEAIIRPGKLDNVKDALSNNGVNGLTVTQVIGCGKQRGHTQVYRGVEYTTHLIPKVKIEIVVKDGDVDSVIQLIVKEARTGEIGDGKIFVSSIENAYTIRTGNVGENAL
jgi:nitrogen regulatory protein P-II 1